MDDTALRLACAAVLLGGCGSVSGTGDAGVDVSTLDADLSGNATVVTQSALFGGTIGAAVADIDVFSNLPNNMPFATAKTDAGGSATIKVYPGGSVTALYKHTVDMGSDLITWVGVKPGDTLTFGNREPSAINQPSTMLGSQTYSWPTLAAATFYEVYTSCNSIGISAPTLTSGALNEFSTCHREPMDILFRAFNSSTLIGYGFRSNVAFTDTATVSLSAWSTTIPNGTINITGLPAEIASLSGSFRTIFDASREVAVSSYSGTPTGGAFSGTFAWHPTGERTIGLLFLSRAGFLNMRVLDSFVAGTLTQTVAAPTFPPWVQSSTIASSALRTARWFIVPSASAVYDGQMLRVAWSHTISSVSHPSQWHFILPPEQTELKLPVLPSQFDDNQPFPQDPMSGAIRVFDISSVTGYDMLRTVASQNILCLECALRAGDFQRVVVTP